MASEWTFRPLRLADLPLFQSWLQRPHVVQWWDEAVSLPELERDFAPAIAGTVPQKCYIALLDGTPAGFIQSYSPVGWHHEGWWLDEKDPNVRGIDQFLADGDRLGQGLGTAMVKAFVARLFADEPQVARIQTDPDPRNLRAIRAYEKADFRRVREIETPDGLALLMYCDRPAPA